MAFSLYSGPIEPDEIFDEETAKGLSGILLLGDDYSGWMYAYDTTTKPWQMRLLDHNEIMPLESGEPTDFTDFILTEFKRSFEIK